jgi:LemA protein
MNLYGICINYVLNYENPINIYDIINMLERCVGEVMANIKLELNKKNLIIIITIVLIILILLSMILTYNDLVRLDQNVEAQWSEIKNQDQRKVDLIPQLVSLNTQYQIFESSTQENITALRSGYLNATTDRERANISDVMGSIMFNEIKVAIEAYPNLDSIQALRDVLDEIAGTENRITYARSEYIDAVREYNTKVRSFPSNIWAGMFGFSERENLFGSAP